MSTTALKAVATGQEPAKPKTIPALLASGEVQAQIKLALPRHMTPERMARIATTEMRKVPKLAQCDPMSFLGAVIQCAQLGLEPGNALGHAYILPFDKREKRGNQWVTVSTEAQVIIGYRGMIDLARRSGQIVSIEARAVFEGDKFECVLGLHSRIEHVPDWQNANRTMADKLRFVYAVAKLKDGGVQFDVMSRAEVDGIRARSKSKDNGPWVTDYPAMALKSVVRRLFKFLPVSVEIQTAVGLDEQADAGISQQNRAVIDGQFTEISDYAGDDAPQIDADGVITEVGTDERKPPEFTVDQVDQALKDAKTLDVLDEAAALIKDVGNVTQQKALNATYLARRSELGAD